MSSYIDGDLTTEQVIDYRLQEVFGDIADSTNYTHVQTLTVGIDNYIAANPTAITKEYDFSAGVDVTTSVRGTIVGNQDAVGDGFEVHDDCLMFYCDATLLWREWVLTAVSSDFSVPYRILGRIYIPHSLTNVNGVTITGRNSDLVSIAVPIGAVNKWTIFDITLIPPTDGKFYFQPTKNGDPVFAGANSQFDDNFFIKDLVVSPANGKAREFFRNPKTGVSDKCALVGERIVSVDRQSLYFERVYAPLLASMNAYSAENMSLPDWSGLKIGGTLVKAFNFSATADGITATRGTATANQDGITDGTISKDNTLVFFADAIYNTHYAAIVGLNPDMFYRVQGFAYVPAGQTAVDFCQIRSRDTAGDTVLTVIATDSQGWQTVDLVLRPNDEGEFRFELRETGDDFLIGANLITDDRVYLVGLTVTTHQYYGASFDTKKQYIYPDRVAISAVGEPEDQEVETSVSEVAAPQGTLHYASSIDSDGDFTTDLTQTAVEIQDDIPAWYDATRSAVKEGSKVTLFASRTTATAAQLWANLESAYISGLPAGIAYTITGSTTSLVIEFFKSQATVQGNVHYASSIASDGDFTVSLALDAGAIQAALPAWYDGTKAVVKEGSKVTLFASRTTATAAQLWANLESAYISGLPAGIGHTITGLSNYIVIEFFDSNPSKTTLSTATAVRKLTAAGHDITAGADVAIWNSDNLLAATYAVSVSGDDVCVPVGFLGGKNNTATHIGKNSTRVGYQLGNKVCQTKTAIDFFIPGFTAGITTADDIPAVQGGEDAQSMLDAAVAGTATIKVSGSRIGQLHPRLFYRESPTVKATSILI